MVASRKYPGKWDQKEKWYGTRYTRRAILASTREQLSQAAKNPSPGLHLPQPNVFIPANLEATIMDDGWDPEPRLIHESPIAHVWYKHGFHVPGYKKGFQLPNAYIIIHCRSPLAHASAKRFVAAELYVRLVDDAMKENSYSARVAGFRHLTECLSTGIKIELSGYVSTLHVLLEQVMKTLKDPQVLQHFEVIKQRLSSTLENYASQQPYYQVFWLARQFTRKNWYTHQQMLEELRALTVADVEKLYQSLFERMHIEILIGGGISEDEALRMSKKVETFFSPTALPLCQMDKNEKSLGIIPGSNFVHRHIPNNSQIVDHCIAYHLYTGPRFHSPTRAKTFLLGQMAETPAFDQLRTQEQLGYVVLSVAEEDATEMRYKILIQGERDPMHLEVRIEAFFHIFANILERMSDDTFDIHKESLIKKFLGDFGSKNLEEEATRVWSYISTGHCDFRLGMLSSNPCKSC